MKSIHKPNQMYWSVAIFKYLKRTTLPSLRIVTLLLLYITASNIGLYPVGAQGNTLVRRVNIPYFGVAPPVEDYTPAIFWFGKITPTSNYTDVRIFYYDAYLKIVVHVVDRLLWYDPSPTIQDFTNWDSVSVYLDLDGNTGNAPDQNSYRLISQLNWWEDDRNWQIGFRGNGSEWVIDSVEFESETSWRGNAPNDTSNDSGWVASFTIPFSSLGLSIKPPTDTIWGLAIIVHDRDDEVGIPIPNNVWPENMNLYIPSTWGEIRFGAPGYTHPPALPAGEIIIRQGLKGMNVVDAHVGGHTICGGDIDKWTEWGEANYAGYGQINIQNQMDISDWPCFSKFYVTFPLGSIPPGQTIISASLTMHLFGNAGGGVWGEPPDSFIQVFTVSESWDEMSITWNNAPWAQENIAGTWVHPMQGSLVWPGEPYTWNVSQAVNEAYLEGRPLNLALYSADSERHTGKYFSSSDTGDWNALARPTLTIRWGNLCETPGVNCRTVYLPLIKIQ